MSSREDIDVTYGVNNDFFRLWLDESMTYTCALYLNGNETLEQAQLKKHAFLSDAARIDEYSHVLDIGCGWGANLHFLSQVRNVTEAVGITLSKDQHEEISSRNIPNTQVQFIDYRDYHPEQTFNAIISIGMFEHVATPQQTRRGDHIDIYRNYFRLAWEWSSPGTHFGLQTVVGARMPRRNALKEIGWVTSTIFPGAISPRIEAIFESILPYWEVVALHTRREHYAKTTAEWLRRLENNENTIRTNYGNQVFDEYQRYLKACVIAFEEGYQSLAQFSLRRINH